MENVSLEIDAPVLEHPEDFVADLHEGLPYLILNDSGRVVRKSVLRSGTAPVGITGLDNGTYYIRMMNGRSGKIVVSTD